LTGHREPHNQTAFACTAPGAGQHRDSAEGAGGVVGYLHLILQHVLPKGFRRVRDYGFLHGNAKKLLSLVQLILHVVIEVIKQRPRPVFKCPRCQSPMVILGFRRTVWESG